MPQRHSAAGLEIGEIAMKREASGRSALIFAIALCACFSGPMLPAAGVAAPAASQDAASPAAKKKTVNAHTPQKPPPAKPTAEKTKDASRLDSVATTPAEVTPEGAIETTAPTAIAPPSAALAPSIANANAQFPPVTHDAASSDAIVSQATPDPSRAHQTADDRHVVAPDEVNELDRAAGDTPPPAVMAASTTEPTIAAPAPTTVGAAQVSSATSNDGAWDKASLIGKIFIAAGGLLTLASAARMFMA
ncbi:hypothetical protein [Rhodopseudomonas pseudopalustris]|uniref:hypothetical protein n=1 Tax=Rhodopseudomonas pseudopalustris TaxID=1513892 RepID=UPI003F9B6AEC